ncbi:MAG: tetratricopeptide repeat protein [Bacteroidales bacterium]|nr:tetratricopeptide repeat protein [Bacteroidales bacterium]
MGKLFRLTILFFLLFLTSEVCLSQESDGLLAKCIDSSAVYNHSLRNEINTAKLCAKTFSDEFSQSYSEFTDYYQHIQSGEASKAIYDAVKITKISDAQKYLMMARTAVLCIDMKGARNYYAEMLNQANAVNFKVVLEYAKFSTYTLNIETAKQLSRQALMLAKTKAEKFEALYNLAYLNYRTSNENISKQQLKLADRAAKTFYQKGLVSMLRGMVEVSLSNFDSALYFYNLSLFQMSKVENCHIEPQLIELDKSRIYQSKENYDKALSCLDSALIFAQKYENDVDRRIAVSSVYLHKGAVYNQLADLQQAREMFNESLKQIMEIVNSNPNYVADLAEVESYQAQLELDTKNYRRAESLCDDAYNIYSDKRFEKSEQAIAGKASVLNTYGNIFTATSYYSKAQKNYETALETYASLVNKSSDKYEVQRATVLNNLGHLFDLMGQFDEAMQDYKAAIKMLEKNVKGDRTITSNYIDALSNTGDLYRRYGRLDSALKYLNIALEMFEGKAHFTDVETFTYSTICNNLAVIYKSQGDYDNAQHFFSKTYILRKELSDKADIYLSYFADILSNYGSFYLDVDDYDLAVYYLEKSLEIRKQQVEKGAADYDINMLADNYDNLAYLYIRIDKESEAISNFELSKEIRKPIVTKHPDTYLYDYCSTLYNLATLYKNNGRNLEALSVLLELKETYTELIKDFTESNYAELANVNHNIAIVYGILGNKGQAYATMNEVLSEYSALCNINPEKYQSEVADALNQLGNYATDLSEFQLAEKYYKKSIKMRTELAENGLISYHQVASTYNNLGLLYFKQLETVAAKNCYYEALKFFASVPQETFNIETILSFAMTNINITECLIFEKNSGESEIEYETCKNYLTKAMDSLKPYLYNNSANYYYDYAEKLLNNLTQ